MAIFKAWTASQLTNFGLWLASAVGADTAPPIAAGNTWTPESLAAFGLAMSRGFGSGL